VKSIIAIPSRITVTDHHPTDTGLPLMATDVRPTAMEMIADTSP
jgi:hypothetical protein